eukprot:TRINITY_DN16883_c1_g1_i3.p2 TRINITY_DN16883_c1_g1~~TRINITY_DN16883_c1_g1_i3.p2  ORF type:complete len:398 (+),score=134.04 TRINITY_DN16883_c1_g1_i3:70-1194(+)
MAGGPANPGEQRRRLELKAVTFAKKVLHAVAAERRPGKKGCKYRLEQVTSRLTLLPADNQEGLFRRGITAHAATLTCLSYYDLRLFHDCTVFQPAFWAKAEVEMVQALHNAPQKAVAHMNKSRNVAVVLAAAGIHGLPAQVASYIADHHDSEQEQTLDRQIYEELLRRVNAVAHPERDVKAEADGLAATLVEWYKLWVDATMAWDLYQMGPEAIRSSSTVAAHHRIQARELLETMRLPPRPRPAPRLRTKPSNAPGKPANAPGKPQQWELQDENEGDEELEPYLLPGNDRHGEDDSWDCQEPALTPEEQEEQAPALTPEEQEDLVMAALARDAALLRDVIDFPGGAAARECSAHAREVYEQYKRKQRGEGSSPR